MPVARELTVAECELGIPPGETKYDQLNRFSRITPMPNLASWAVAQAQRQINNSFIEGTVPYLPDYG
jgi:hypothetical protein